MFNDIYLSSSDKAALSAACAGFLNVIGPTPGRAAAEALTDADGSSLPAVAAVGDPAQWYAAIRTNEPLSLPEGVFSCDAEVVKALVGVWQETSMD